MSKSAHPWGDESSPFEALGGEAVIRSIVEDFYDIIDAEAPVLRAMLPKDDSTSRRKLGDYIVEWTGGPELYTPERGHPRMKMRHMPFVIAESDARQWLACMTKALDVNDVNGDVRAFLDQRIEQLAWHLVNSSDDDPNTADRRRLTLNQEP